MSDLVRRIIKAVRNAPDTQHARERVAELLATKDQPVSYPSDPTEHQIFHTWLLGQPAVVNCAYAVDPATGALRYYNSEDQAAWEGWQERSKLGNKVGDDEQRAEDIQLLLSAAIELQRVIEELNEHREEDDKLDYETCQQIQEVVDRM